MKPSLLTGAALTNAGNKEKRREHDFYPTPPDVTVALLQFLNLEPSIVWEPACGNGAMSRVIEGFGHTVISTDLRESGYGEGGLDFLNATPYQCDAIITNPPFNISEAFIRKALSVAPIVAMVLKSQYWHAASRKQLFDDCPPAWILPLTWRPDFLFDTRASGEKSAPTMDCIWAVWSVGDTDTKFRPLKRPKEYLLKPMVVSSVNNTIQASIFDEAAA